MFNAMHTAGAGTVRDVMLVKTSPQDRMSAVPPGAHLTLFYNKVQQHQGSWEGGS